MIESFSNVKNEKKYRYEYGIRDIKLKNKEYGKVAGYVSEPHIKYGNIIAVELNVSDELTQISDQPYFNNYGDAIEYYVSFRSNPALNDWIPILPSNYTAINNELLFIKDGTATLRFPVSDVNSIKVYKNNIRFYNFEYLNSTIIVKESVLSNDIFTISYLPDNKYKQILTTDLDKIISMTTEYFNNTSIKLSHIPIIDGSFNISLSTEYLYGQSSADMYKYVDMYGALTKEEISKSLPRITLKEDKDLKAYDNTVVTETITDENGSTIITSMLYPFIDCNLIGNDLIFSNIPALAMSDGVNTPKAVAVSYNYQQVTCLVKIILRNTSLIPNSTPKVHNYKLNFRLEE